MTTPIYAITALVLMAGTATAGTLRYAEDQGPAIVNPLFSTTMSEARLDSLVFEGLFADDKELRSVSALAASLTLAEDGLSALISLRVSHWHDGSPVSAADVAFTIAAMQDI